MMGRLILVAILIIQSCSSSISQTTSSSGTPHVAPGITLVDNGYSGILIALADSVKQDYRLIQRLQELVNEASATLFKATDNRVYFKNVTILVPHTWKFPEAKASTTESLYKADIRVENPTSAYGNNPWTRQLGACGEPGEYMMLTPDFITSYSNFGSAAKTLVHEWGHLRWGLFDEYPIGDDIKDHFYRSMTNGEIEPTRCSRDVKGHTKNRVTGEQCKIDPVRQVPEADCRFYENNDQTKAQASLMFSTSLSSVTKFCGDEEIGGGTLHNYQAPTAQNLRCLGRSSWSIMKDHSDFNNNSQPINSGTVNTDVAFKFVQKKKSRTVIGMDTSGSMNKNRYFVKLHAAVTMYLNFTVAKGAQIGLVKYNNTAHNVTNGLITIDSQDDRKRLMDRIPMERRGGSAIGKGLKCAIDMLVADGADTRGSRIILYTDGEENGSPTVQEVLPEAIAKGITVDTILITQNASNSLKNLAMQTGGVSFYVSGNRYSTSLLDAFTAIERSRTDDPKTVPVTIHSDVYSVGDNKELCREVLVDNNLGGDTLFLFSWSHYHNNLSISISNSTGSRQAHITDYDITSAALKCAGLCDTGMWEVCILNNRNHTEDVEVQVESRPRFKNASNETQYPIALSTRIVNNEPDFANKYNDPVWLFATVTRGNNAVVGAKVVAHLEYPDVEQYTNITLEMRDDGFGADITEEDGTYSAYILNAETIGKHSIFVEVEGVTDTKVKTVTSYSRSPESKGVSSDQKTEMEATDKFQRYSLVGYIDVKSVIPEHKDMYPPERIIDLEITSTSFTNRSVTLEWTAVGDDLDVGKAKSYVVWRANNHREMYLKRKTESTRVEASEIKKGSLESPKEAYSREKIVVTVPDPDTPQLFAIIVLDHDNNPSRLSNIVTARLKPSKANDDGQRDVKMIIGFTIGFGVPLLILIVLVILFATGLIRGHKKLEVSEKYFDHRNTAYSDCS